MNLLGIILAGAVLAVPQARNLPKIDGVIGKTEWNDGVRIAGFLKSAPEPLLVNGGEGFVTFLTDGKRLCAAWRVKSRNVDIGGGLRAAATRRDGDVWDDDALELIVGADGGRVAHFIFNAIGTVYDSMTAPGAKADVKWNAAGVKVASVVRHGWWELEAMVPLSEIGTFKGGIFVNAARVFRGEEASSLTAAPSHIKGDKICLSVSGGASAVQMDSLGSPAEGRWRPGVTVVKGPAGRRYRADALIREIVGERGADGKVEMMASKLFAAGERCDFKLDTRSRSEFRLELTVRDADSGQIIFDRELYARRGVRNEGVPASAAFDLDGAGEVSVYHYPGMNQVRFTFFPFPDAEVEVAQCRIDGKTVRLQKKGGAFTALARTPGSAGRFPVDFAVKGKDGVKRFDGVWTLEKRKFEWEGNDIGKRKLIIEPFRPISVSSSRASVILRDYTFGAAGLLSSLKALDREILAGAMFFYGSVDGKRVKFAGEPGEIRTEDGGYAAVYTATAEAEGVRLTVKGRMEYDGFVWNEVSVSGLNGRQLERLSMVIPLKNEEVPLMHICTVDSIRYNPTGAVPAGEGVVWEGKDLYRKTGFLENMFADQVVPYVWLGAERRGLSWFVNDTFGMVLDKEKSALRLVRDGAVLRMEADFINVPVRLRDGHSFSFGYEATPVKMQDRRMWRHYQTDLGPHPTNFVSRFGIGQGTIGFWNSWARIPYNGDWTLFDLSCRQALTAGCSNELMRAFTAFTNRYDGAMEEYASKLPAVGKQTHFNWMQTCRYHSVLTMSRLKEPTYPFKYSDPTLSWVKDESTEYYKSEWISRSTGYIAATRNFLTPSYLDFIMYYYRKWAEKGIKGIYFDDMFPMTCHNPDTSCKTDAEGVVHGSFGILEMRELVKRAAVMQEEMGVKPRLMQIHMTNCLLVPAFAFGTSMLSWEDHYGDEVFQKRFPVDYVRAESLGSQVGAEAIALDGIKNLGKFERKEWFQKRFPFLTRTQQAVLLPAGVKTWERAAIPGNGLDRKELFKILDVFGRFEIWADDCEFTPFYDGFGGVGGQPPDVLVGVYRRKGKALAVFGNQTGEDFEFDIKADLGMLALKAPLKFTDGENMEPVAGGKLSVPAYDLRLVLIEGVK